MGEEGQADVRFLISLPQDIQDAASSNVRISPPAGVSCAPSHRWHLLIADICYRTVHNGISRGAETNCTEAVAHTTGRATGYNGQHLTTSAPEAWPMLLLTAGSVRS